MKSKKTIDFPERILLTPEEYDRIKELCNNPPEPTPALIDAMKRYKELVKDETKTSKGS